MNIEKQIIFIDKSIDEFNIFYESANNNTYPILYSNLTTKNEIINILTQFEEINRIAFIFMNKELENCIFLENEYFFSNDVNNYNENTKFIIEIIKTFKINHVDFLGCNTLQYDTWKQFYDLLKKETNVIVGASNNATGNVQYGGDWIMENTSEDIENIYFTKNIEYYKYLLHMFGSTNAFIDANGNLFVCGSNTYGGLGLDSTETKLYFFTIVPVIVDLSLDTSYVNLGPTSTSTKRNVLYQTYNASYVSSGQDCTFLITSNGKLFYAGRLGCLVDTTHYITYLPRVDIFTSIPLPFEKKAAYISIGTGYFIVLMTNGQIYAYGTNRRGQLGLGHNNDVYTLTKVGLPSGRYCKSVNCGSEFTIILLDDGYIYTTGYGGNGSLGTGNTSDLNLFTKININNLTISNISCSTYSVAVLTTTNEIYVAGTNMSNMFGIITTAGSKIFTFTKLPTTALGSNVIKEIQLMNGATAIRLQNGQLYGMGLGISLGRGSDTTSLGSFYTNSKLIRFTDSFGMIYAINTSNTYNLFVTGYNTFGQIALATSVNPNTPQNWNYTARIAATDLPAGYTTGSTIIADITYLMGTIQSLPTPAPLLQPTIDYTNIYNKSYGDKFQLYYSSNSTSPIICSTTSSDITLDGSGNVEVINIPQNGYATIEIYQEDNLTYNSVTSIVTINISKKNPTITLSDKIINGILTGLIINDSLKICTSDSNGNLNYSYATTDVISIDNNGNLTALKYYSGDINITISQDATTYYNAITLTFIIRNISKIQTSIDTYGGNTTFYNIATGTKLDFYIITNSDASINYIIDNDFFINDNNFIVPVKIFTGQKFIVIQQLETDTYTYGSIIITIDTIIKGDPFIYFDNDNSSVHYVDGLLINGSFSININSYNLNATYGYVISPNNVITIDNSLNNVWIINAINSYFGDITINVTSFEDENFLSGNATIVIRSVGVANPEIKINNVLYQNTFTNIKNNVPFNLNVTSNSTGAISYFIADEYLPYISIDQTTGIVTPIAASTTNIIIQIIQSATSQYASYSDAYAIIPTIDKGDPIYFGTIVYTNKSVGDIINLNFTSNSTGNINYTISPPGYAVFNEDGPITYNGGIIIIIIRLIAAYNGDITITINQDEDINYVAGSSSAIIRQIAKGTTPLYINGNLNTNNFINNAVSQQFSLNISSLNTGALSFNITPPGYLSVDSSGVVTPLQVFSGDIKIYINKASDNNYLAQSGTATIKSIGKGIPSITVDGHIEPYIFKKTPGNTFNLNVVSNSNGAITYSSTEPTGPNYPLTLDNLGNITVNFAVGAVMTKIINISQAETDNYFSKNITTTIEILQLSVLSINGLAAETDLFVKDILVGTEIPLEFISNSDGEITYTTSIDFANINDIITITKTDNLHFKITTKKVYLDQVLITFNQSSTLSYSGASRRVIIDLIMPITPTFQIVGNTIFENIKYGDSFTITTSSNSAGIITVDSTKNDAISYVVNNNIVTINAIKAYDRDIKLYITKLAYDNYGEITIEATIKTISKINPVLKINGQRNTLSLTKAVGDQFNLIIDCISIIDGAIVTYNTLATNLSIQKNINQNADIQVLSAVQTLETKLIDVNISSSINYFSIAGTVQISILPFATIMVNRLNTNNYIINSMYIDDIFDLNLISNNTDNFIISVDVPNVININSTGKITANVYYPNIITITIKQLRNAAFSETTLTVIINKIEKITPHISINGSVDNYSFFNVNVSDILDLQLDSPSSGTITYTNYDSTKLDINTQNNTITVKGLSNNSLNITINQAETAKYKSNTAIVTISAINPIPATILINGQQGSYTFVNGRLNDVLSVTLVSNNTIGTFSYNIVTNLTSNIIRINNGNIELLSVYDGDILIEVTQSAGGIYLTTTAVITIQNILKGYPNFTINHIYGDYNFPSIKINETLNLRSFLNSSSDGEYEYECESPYVTINKNGILKVYGATQGTISQPAIKIKIIQLETNSYLQEIHYANIINTQSIDNIINFDNGTNLYENKSVLDNFELEISNIGNTMYRFVYDSTLLFVTPDGWVNLIAGYSGDVSIGITTIDNKDYNSTTATAIIRSIRKLTPNMGFINNIDIFEITYGSTLNIFSYIIRGNTNGNYTYISSNIAVVTVSDTGIISPIAYNSNIIAINIISEETPIYNSRTITAYIKILKKNPNLTFINNITTFTMFYTDTLDLKAFFSSDSSGNISFESMNPNLISVNPISGLVTILNVSSVPVYINVKQDETSMHYSTNVMITINTIKEITNISLNDNQSNIINIPFNTILDLNTYLITNNTESNIIYTTQSPNMQIINSHFITGLKKTNGNNIEIITATQNSSTNYSDGIYTILAKVLGILPNIQIINNNNTNNFSVELTKTLDLLPYISSDSGGSYTFISSNINVATVNIDTGVVTPKSVTTSPIIITITQNETYIYKTNSIDVYLTVTSSQTELPVPPNPTKIDPIINISKKIIVVKLTKKPIKLNAISTNTTNPILYSTKSKLFKVNKSSGIITLIKKGRGTITLTQVANDTYNAINTFVTIVIN